MPRDRQQEKSYLRCDCLVLSQPPGCQFTFSALPSLFFFFLSFYWSTVDLVNFVLVSDIQQSESVIHIFPLF